MFQPAIWQTFPALAAVRDRGSDDGFGKRHPHIAMRLAVLALAVEGERVKPRPDEAGVYRNLQEIRSLLDKIPLRWLDVTLKEVNVWLGDRPTRMVRDAGDIWLAHEEFGDVPGERILHYTAGLKCIG